MRTLFDKLNVTLLILMTSLLAPAVRAQDTFRLSGKDTWDFYVYGNGNAIAQILTAVKLMIAPDEGGDGFRYLLLFLATIGFIVLAVRAGYDPGRNFTKMLGFILMIWAVMYGTTGARVNMQIYDQMTGESRIVDGVPALVGMPASVISQTGEWLTRQIEQNFSIPGSLKVSESGQFNLFGRVLQEMNQFVISDDYLSRSLKAYVADCVVPAMALGRVSANDFHRDAKLVETLGKAQSVSLLTRYYELGAEMAANNGLGELVSCTGAYESLKQDLESHAEALVDAKNDQWASTGIMVPFEQAASDALGQAAASGGGNPLARYGRPQGIILQKALSSHLHGAFREAAVRTGNNELMMSTAIAQAEQSQRSAWWTAAEIFKNMMGYVYLVLQAFIFAIVPVVIIGLMIPGLGGKIFTNYFQILVWLTLWTPMLAVVSFLIMVFGDAQLRETLEVAGLTMENSVVVTEASNNLVIAAQFIGTMVPLITWGLVKGAMAFTEFVSHGIGSAFATQAGAQAATGNVSMGNLSMDNVGMNKYSTTMSSGVGQQAVQADYGHGMGLGRQDQGGTALSVSGQNANITRSNSQSRQAIETLSKQTGLSFEELQAEVVARQKAVESGLSTSESYGATLSRVEALTENKALMSKLSASEQQSLAEHLQAMNKAVESTNAALHAAADVSGGVGIPFAMKVGGEFGTKIQAANSAADEHSRAINAILTTAASRSDDWSEGTSSSDTASQGSSASNDAAIREALNEGRSIQETANRTWRSMAQDTQTVATQLASAQGRDQRVAESAGGWQGGDFDVGWRITAHEEALEAGRLDAPSGGPGASFEALRDENRSALASGGERIGGAFETQRDDVEGQQNDGFRERADAALNQGEADVVRQVTDIEGDSARHRRDMNERREGTDIMGVYGRAGASTLEAGRGALDQVTSLWRNN